MNGSEWKRYLVMVVLFGAVTAIGVGGQYLFADYHLASESFAVVKIVGILTEAILLAIGAMFGGIGLFLIFGARVEAGIKKLRRR